MITFKMAGHDYLDIVKRLAEDHIRVRQVNEGGLNCVRVSFYINNAPEDVEKIINSLKKIS
jgi:selenocysteine lyase/cysteine desulfurase